MESRRNERFTTETEIFIYKYGVKIARGKIKNRSRFGLFVESPLRDIKISQPIDIRLTLYENSAITRCYIFNSIVIHTTETGFGVVFDSIDEN